MQISILCFDGVDELDVIGPYRVFAGADQADSPISVVLTTVEPRDHITTSYGLDIAVHGTIRETDPDILVVPGGGWNSRNATSAWAEAERGAIPAVISEFHEEDRIIAGVCTGTMLIERAGILTGRRAITHAGAVDELQASDAIVVRERVVDDGDIVTAGGVTSGIDLALHLLEREFDESRAEAVATNLEYQRQQSIFST